MDIGFYHPARGYWQTDDMPRAEILAMYPEGTLQVPVRPGPTYDWVNGQWVDVPPAPPTAAELDVEANQLADAVLQQNKDNIRIMGEVLAEVIFRVSNNQIPANLTLNQARTWVRNTFRDKFRELL